MHISHRCTLGFLHTISFNLLVCTLRAVSIAIWKESLTKLPVCDAFWRVIVCLLAGARWKHWKFFSCANLIIVHHTTFVAIQAFLVDWAGKEMPSLNHWETQFQSSHISVKPNDNNRSLLYNYLNSFFKPLTFRLAKCWQVLLSRKKIYLESGWENENTLIFCHIKNVTTLFTFLFYFGRLVLMGGAGQKQAILLPRKEGDFTWHYQCQG